MRFENLTNYLFLLFSSKLPMSLPLRVTSNRCPDVLKAAPIFVSGIF